MEDEPTAARSAGMNGPTDFKTVNKRIRRKEAAISLQRRRDEMSEKMTTAEMVAGLRKLARVLNGNQAIGPALSAIADRMQQMADVMRRLDQDMVMMGSLELMDELEALVAVDGLTTEERWDERNND